MQFLNLLLFASLAEIQNAYRITISLLHNNQNNKDYAKEIYYFAIFASGYMQYVCPKCTAVGNQSFF